MNSLTMALSCWKKVGGKTALSQRQAALHVELVRARAMVMRVARVVGGESGLCFGVDMDRVVWVKMRLLVIERGE
jgi:hypothetical protein